MNEIEESFQELTTADDSNTCSYEKSSSPSRQQELQLHAIAQYFVFLIPENEDEPPLDACAPAETEAGSGVHVQQQMRQKVVSLFRQFLHDYDNQQESLLPIDNLSSRWRIILLYNIMMAKCRRLPKELPVENSLWQITETTVWWMDKLPCKLEFANLKHTIRQQPIVRIGRRQAQAQVGNLAYPEGGDYKSIRKRLGTMHDEILQAEQDPRELTRLMIESRRTGKAITADCLKGLGCRCTKSDVDLLNRIQLLLDIEVVRRLHSFKPKVDLHAEVNTSMEAGVPSCLSVTNEFDSIPIGLGIARFLSLCEAGELRLCEIFTKPGYPIFNDNPYHRIKAMEEIEERYSEHLARRCKQEDNETISGDSEFVKTQRKDSLSSLLSELETFYGP